MLKVLITGVNGFLAKYLAKYLVESTQSVEIVGLSRSTRKDKPEELFKVYDDVDKLIQKEPHFDCIFHLAAFIPYNNLNEHNSRLVDDNILLTAKLTKAYPNSRFIFSSSTSVYGKPQHLPIDVLTSAYHQPNIYGLSKLAAETIVLNHENYVIIRFSSIIGPGMKPISFIPKIIEDAKKGNATLNGDGSRIQDYIDVRDAARLCAISGMNKKKNFIILGASGNSISNKNVVSIIQKHIHFSVKFEGSDNSPSFEYKTNDHYNMIDFKLSYSIQQTIKDMTTL